MELRISSMHDDRKLFIGGPDDGKLTTSSLLRLFVVRETEDAKEMSYYHLEVIAFDNDEQILFYRHESLSLEDSIKQLFYFYADNRTTETEVLSNTEESL